MNDFDKAGRFAIKDDPQGHVAWLLPGFTDAYRFREWIDTRQLPFPGEKDRVCDTVAAMEAPRQRGWAIILELLSEPQTAMLPRIVDYGARLHLELLAHAATRSHHVGLVILDLTGPPQPDTIDMRIPGTSGGQFTCRVVRRNFRSESATGTLAEIAAGRLSASLLSWIPLMNGADQLGIIEQWVELAEREPDIYRRSLWADIAGVFASLADREEWWKASLQELKMVRSKYAEALREEGRQEGRQEGREEGRQEGREEGATEAAVDLIVALLGKHLERAIPTRVPNALRKLNLAQLQQLVLTVTDVQSLAEFERAIPKASK